jgi:alanine dehydrogenase
MKIGVPKEVKIHEYRVGLVPGSVYELIAHGHEVFVETNAGKGINISDADYEKAGAKILNTPAEIFAVADMIVKVKEPQPEECKLLRPHQVLFTYLHLAPDLVQTQLLLESQCIAIAYETVTDARGGLPLLTPMSEVAGRMSIQAGAHCLEREQGGSGLLLGGVPGVAAANVLVLGGGVVGTNAIRMAIGLGAQVTVIDKSLKRLQELDFQFGNQLTTLYSTQFNIAEQVSRADLVIGAVLVPGAAAPKLISAAMVQSMQPGSVIVDVAIDQGGCSETSRPTTHAHPTYIESGVVHYCVTNMPGAVARTGAFALNNATLPFVLALANKGWKRALTEDQYLAQGLNIYKGHVVYQAVAQALEYEYLPLESVLA